MSPKFRKVHRPPLLPIADRFPYKSIVYGIWAPGVCSSWTIYGTQRRASNHPVCLSERSGYLWCSFVLVPCTAKCLGEWAGEWQIIVWNSLDRGLHDPNYWIVQVYFGAAFHMANHQGILYRLCSVGIGSSVLFILTPFLSNRSQHVMVDDYRSNLVDIV